MPYRFNIFTGEFDVVDLTQSGGDFASTFNADSGSATAVNSEINLFGTSAQGLTTSASGNTVIFTNEDSSTSQKGVLETSTNAESIIGISDSVAVVPSSLSAKLGDQTQYAIPYGNTSLLAIQWTDPLNDGEIVIGATGGVPAAANITSTGGTIDITNGANSINIETSTEVSIQFDTDSGSAIPDSGVITIAGGTLINTAGATSIVTINADDSVISSVVSDSGTATGSSNSVSLVGSGAISTSATGDTLTIADDGTYATTYTSDSGSASPSSNNLNIFGSSAITTSATGDTLTIADDGTYATTYTADSGSATPSSNNLNIVGSGGITTSATGSTVTIIGTSEQIIPVTLLDDGDSPYTVLSTDYYLSCDVSSGVLEIDLPDAGNQGRVVIVKDSGGDAATNNITVTTVTGTDLIDGATTFVMNTNYEAANFLDNGTSWEVF